MASLPANLKLFFWDTDFSKIDPYKHQEYVITRILEYGDPDALRWLFNTFPRPTVINTVKKNRQLSAKSANFWAEVLKIDKQKVKCLQPPYQAKSRQAWPY